MRILSSIPVILMMVFMLYAFWDLKVTGFKPPVPVDALADKNQEIEAIMADHRESLRTEMSSVVLPQIDESLATIVAEYGEFSPEHNQGLIDAALMLSDNARTDLAQTYMAKAVDVSREVYGTDHRETALNLNDLANLTTDANGQNYSEEAISYLRQALDIRKNVLTEDHQERLANEVNLADQLFLEWQAKGSSQEDRSGLDEAASHLEHVIKVHDELGEEANAMNKAGARLLFARVSFYQENYETAATFFEETLAEVSEETDPATYVVLNTSYAEYIVSLMKTGREDEAEKMKLDIVRFIQAAQQAVQSPAPSTDESPSQ